MGEGRTNHGQARCLQHHGPSASSAAPTPTGGRRTRAGAGREILVFGSRTIWNDLLADGLVDELHLILGPAVVGGGTPIFGTRPPGPLRLAETRRFDGSDNLLLRYEVGRGTG